MAMIIENPPGIPTKNIKITILIIKENINKKDHITMIKIILLGKDNSTGIIEENTLKINKVIQGKNNIHTKIKSDSLFQIKENILNKKIEDLMIHKLEGKEKTTKVQSKFIIKITINIKGQLKIKTTSLTLIKNIPNKIEILMEVKISRCKFTIKIKVKSMEISNIKKKNNITDHIGTKTDKFTQDRNQDSIHSTIRDS
jgi:hypothetical protein